MSLESYQILNLYLPSVQIFTVPDERKAWVAGYDLSVINTAIKYNWPNE